MRFGSRSGSRGRRRSGGSRGSRDGLGSGLRSLLRLLALGGLLALFLELLAGFWFLARLLFFGALVRGFLSRAAADAVAAAHAGRRLARAATSAGATANGRGRRGAVRVLGQAGHHELHRAVD